jgi:hypothetical protein
MWFRSVAIDYYKAYTFFELVLHSDTIEIFWIIFRCRTLNSGVII